MFKRSFHSSAYLLKTPLVRLGQPFGLGTTSLDSQYRSGYDPLYTSPSHELISIIKRACLGFGVAGIYISHLVYTTPLFADYLAYVVAAGSIVPLPVIHLLTQHHVSRIFRLYDSTKTQTLENLTNDETLIAEKIGFTGRRYYNSLIKVKDLEIIDESPIKANWKTKNGLFYVIDDLGGIKMDRIWGIAEHNTGIDNGRYFGK